jgi:hypothetical protein
MVAAPDWAAMALLNSWARGSLLKFLNQVAAGARSGSNA